MNATALGRALVLVVLAAAAGFVAQAARLPGAWLIGPMLVGIVAGVYGVPRSLFPRWLTLAGQGVVGTLVAAAFDPASLPKIAANWGAVLLAIAGTLAASATVGILLARFSTLDRATATLGTLPGGAQATLALSIAIGADTPAIALMQYSRIVLTVLSASIVGRIALAIGGPIAAAAPSVASAAGPSASILTYLLTALIAGVGVSLGVLLRFPAGVVLGPLVLGVAAIELGSRLAWPIGVAEAAYVLIGLGVGLMFDRVALRVIRRQLPAMVASIVGLIVICGGVGALLATLTGADYLTGFLATTPGGMDSLPAIALSSGADVSLMLAVQMARLFAVVLFGPSLARWLLARAPGPRPATALVRVDGRATIAAPTGGAIVAVVSQEAIQNAGGSGANAT